MKKPENVLLCLRNRYFPPETEVLHLMEETSILSDLGNIEEGTGPDEEDEY